MAGLRYFFLLEAAPGMRVKPADARRFSLPARGFFLPGLAGLAACCRVAWRGVEGIPPLKLCFTPPSSSCHFCILSINPNSPLSSQG